MRCDSLCRATFIGMLVGLTACGSGSAASTPDPAPDSTSAPASASTLLSTGPSVSPSEVQDGDAREQLFPDVIDARAERRGDTWTFHVTISSPYDSADRYADGWRILAPDGTELGFRLLTHDHASEQPFTRSLEGVEIPDDIDVVTVEGRDQQNGFGGTTFELPLPT